jgi:putative lysine/arginine/ornithine/histidine/octopine transport system permease protein
VIDLDLLQASLPRLLRGMAVTVELLAVALALGLLIALPLALMGRARSPWLRAPAVAYIFFFRGTPLLVQIFLIYYGSGQFRDLFESLGLWVVLREAYWCAILAFALNTAAYTAEILRGAIGAVPRGEVEAGRALGLGTPALYRLIILPRAVRLALPAYGNEVVLMMKGSALASTIALVDLMGAAKAVYSRTFALEVYGYAAVLYLVLAFAVGFAVRRLERYLSPEYEAGGR